MFTNRTPLAGTLGHTSFAEDLPLRARAADIDGQRTDAGAEFNSLDHVWYGRVSVNGYEFSDTNERRSLFAALGYAFEMLPYREQRVYVEWYQSRNTIDGRSLQPAARPKPGLVHRTDFICESPYQRPSTFVPQVSPTIRRFRTHSSAEPTNRLSVRRIHHWPGPALRAMSYDG